MNPREKRIFKESNIRRPQHISFAAATVVLTCVLCCSHAGSTSPGEADPRLVELISKLDDPKPTVRRPAAYAIAHSVVDPTPALDAMIKVLEGDDLQMQASATLAVARMGANAERAIPALEELLSDPGQGLAIPSIRALESIGTKAIPVLANTLRHPDAKVASVAAEELGNVGALATPAIPALLQAARHNDRNVSKNAVRALLYIGRDGMEAAATLLHSDLQQDRRGDISRAILLAPVDATVAIPALVRAGACATLKRVGENSVPPLLEVLKSGNPRERGQAISCLGEIGPPAVSAITPILTIANDPSNDRGLRSRAIRAVGRSRYEALQWRIQGGQGRLRRARPRIVEVNVR